MLVVCTAAVTLIHGFLESQANINVSRLLLGRGMAVLCMCTYLSCNHPMWLSIWSVSSLGLEFNLQKILYNVCDNLNGLLFNKLSNI